MLPLSRKLSIILCSLLGLIAAARAEDPLQKRSEEIFPLPLDGALTLEHSDGSIHIYGWYEPRVRLVAVRKAYTALRLEQIRVETKSEPSALMVRTVIPPVSGLFADRSGTIEYTLTVPEPARLKLRMASGEISLQGLRGAKVDLAMENGRLLVINSYAEIRARARNGVLEALFEWWEKLPAKFDYAMERGRIAVRLPSAAQFRIEARTEQGRVHDEFHFPPPTNLGVGQTLTAATAPDPPVSLGLRTGSGNVSLEAIR